MKRNPMNDQTASKLITSALRPSPLDPFSYMKNAPQIKARGYKGLLTLDDLIVLYVAGETILKTIPELKGESRRKLRLAVNRAKRDVSKL